MSEIRITGLHLSRPPRNDGEAHLATFSCALGPVIVRGLALRRFEGGGILATLPSCKSNSHQFRFVDRKTQLQVTEAALVLFRAMGGVVAGHDDA